MIFPINTDHHQIPEKFNLYRRDLAINGPTAEGKIAKENKTQKVVTTTAPFTGKRGKVSGLSESSKRRLLFIIRQPGIPLISMWTASYHAMHPSNGKVLKQHLNALLTKVRLHYPDIGYLWVLEFQKGINRPHFHIFFTEPATENFRTFLATSWNKITRESKKHGWQHKKSKSLVNWKMGNGAYVLKKYSQKEKQHIVPEGFVNVGRLWGNSKNIRPVPLSIKASQLINETCIHYMKAWKFVLRTARRYQEATIREYGHKFKSGVMRGGAAWIKDGSLIVLQLVRYLKRQYPVEAAIVKTNLSTPEFGHHTV
jgi:hypothetical protein